jgi:hypothetical protein
MNIADEVESMTTHLIKHGFETGGLFHQVLSVHGSVVIKGRTKRSVSFFIVNNQGQRQDFIIKIQEN